MILITGFAPFAGDTENPSRLAAKAAVALLNETSSAASFLEVPVVFKTSGPTVLGEIARLNAANPADPVSVVICAGLAGNRTEISVEDTAVNLQDARIPDNDGDAPRGTPVIPHAHVRPPLPSPGPRPSCPLPPPAIETGEPNSNHNPDRPRADTLAARIPTATALAALKDAGIPSHISHDAGLYVCNCLFYYTVHEIAGDVKVGFVHVPPAEAVSVAKQAEALAIVARTALAAA